jgi:hypothetical protein
VAALLVVAAVGSGVALAIRTSPRPAVATAHAVDTGTAAQDQPAAQAPAGQTAGQRTKPEESGQPGGGAEPKDRVSRSADTSKGAAVLPDGVHHAIIRKVDAANDRVTVDMVQLICGRTGVNA